MPKRRPPLTDEEGEVRELTREDFRGMRPVREVMPEFIEAMDEFRRKLGRPKAQSPKVHIGFRLASDVVASIKASGRGSTPASSRLCARRGLAARTSVKRPRPGL